MTLSIAITRGGRGKTEIRILLGGASAMRKGTFNRMRRCRDFFSWIVPAGFEPASVGPKPTVVDLLHYGTKTCAGSCRLFSLSSACSAGRHHRHFFAGLLIAGWAAVFDVAGSAAVCYRQLHRAFGVLYLIYFITPSFLRRFKTNCSASFRSKSISQMNIDFNLNLL